MSQLQMRGDFFKVASMLFRSAALLALVPDSQLTGHTMVSKPWMSII
jgi:hypothetical protein